MRTKRSRYAAVLIVTALSLAWALPSSAAPQQVTTTYQMPVQVAGTVTTTECSNSPGPWITFEGSLALPGLTVRLIFGNNINKDVHTVVKEATADVTVVPENGTIKIPKQPSRGGVGGNPFIWVRLYSGSSPLTEEVFLGRCVQGSFTVAPTAIALLTTALAQVEVADCTNNPGPFIYVDGGLKLASGLQAQFVFRNNDNPVGGPHEADGVANVDLLPAGWAFQIPKQPVQGGAGGNPWISVRFLQALRGSEPEAVGPEFLLGRCVQLAPGN